MNSKTDLSGALDKDVILLSPHKFIGGPATPGLLVIKRKLLKNSVPAQPGGGTVSYVNSHDHRYVSDPETREEGGTPSIIGSIRAGLVFQLKHDIGADKIEKLDEQFREKAFRAWGENSNIEILGNLDAQRLAIISFIIKRGKKALHHDFVVALLNDLFGIQARGGCSCAGPYGHRLLHIDNCRSRDFEKVVANGANGIKPGWVRLGFNYFFDNEPVEYIIAAGGMIADEGWKLLPSYSFDEQTGIWHHIKANELPIPDLRQISCPSGKMDFHPNNNINKKPLKHYLDQAQLIFANASKSASVKHHSSKQVSDDFVALRWFHTPEDGLHDLQNLTGLR
jgi:hypothetical protein